MSLPYAEDMKKIIIVTGSVRKIGWEPAKVSEEWTAKGYYLDSCSDIGGGKAKLVFKKVKGWKVPVVEDDPECKKG